MYIDTHTHLHFETYASQLPAVMERAQQAAVKQMITVGVSVADSRAAVALARAHEGIFASVGIHPTDADLAAEDLTALEPLLAQPKVVAIGECGFDFYHGGASRELQEKVLRFQLQLAVSHKLPLIFHVREAFDDFYRVVADYPGLKGVVHCFTGSREDLERGLALGFYFALNGIATYSKSAEQLETFKAIPADRLVLETDCPFLSPAPYRGQTNEPARIATIAQSVATLRAEEVGALAAATSANAQLLFGLGVSNG